MATLYIVATPIGNLEDITLRALRILKEVHLIACEDTRQTQKLLDHYAIRKPTVSYHDHNEQSRAPELLAKLEAGTDIALVTDAGTPLVSDPGYRLVRAAAQAGINIVPVPGASAMLLALSASGLPTDQFRFCGFLPPKSGQRRHTLENLREDSSTLVFYEAPHRIIETLEDIEAVLGARETVIARELTKLHEEFIRGTPEELLAILRERPSIKGEITLLVAKATEPVAIDEPLETSVDRLEKSGLSRMDAIKHVARQHGLSKRDVYTQLQKK